MCGTILEPARRAIAPAAASVPTAAPRAVESQPAASVRAPAIAAPIAAPSAPVPAPRATVSEPTPPISGPSLLGLDQGNVDVLRERAFSGFSSYAEPEEPRSARKEVLLTVVLIAALGGAGWWTYKNYIRVTGSSKPAAEVTAPRGDAASTLAEDSTSKPADKAIPKADTPAAEPKAPESQPEKASAPPEAKPPVATPEPAEAKQAEAAPEIASKAVAPVPEPVRHEVSAERAPAPRAVAVDTGDALFRRGESYLYGRNGAADCGNAIKYLKMAADKQHAKARSMMGTMYATGHCVPRDLPSSYRWFALALRVDPNNSIVEKNLSAVWNQMTPPERQLATKSQ